MIYHVSFDFTLTDLNQLNLLLKKNPDNAALIILKEIFDIRRSSERAIGNYFCSLHPGEFGDKLLCDNPINDIKQFCNLLDCCIQTLKSIEESRRIGT